MKWERRVSASDLLVAHVPVGGCPTLDGGRDAATSRSMVSIAVVGGVAHGYAPDFGGASRLS